MRWFLWPAFVLAVVYSALASWLLSVALRGPSGVDASAGLFIVGAPWIWTGIFGRYYWLAIPMNGLTLYFLIILAVAAYQHGFRGASLK
jgi:hypothetical protein